MARSRRDLSRRFDERLNFRTPGDAIDHILQLLFNRVETLWTRLFQHGFVRGAHELALFCSRLVLEKRALPCRQVMQRILAKVKVTSWVSPPCCACAPRLTTTTRRQIRRWRWGGWRACFRRDQPRRATIDLLFPRVTPLLTLASRELIEIAARRPFEVIWDRNRFAWAS